LIFYFTDWAIIGDAESISWLSLFCYQHSSWCSAITHMYATLGS